MSKILVLGPTGSGKTASLRKLPPDITGIVNIDKKDLILKNALLNYRTQRDGLGKILLNESNYIETSKPAGVKMIMTEWEKRADLQVLVLDTITHLITADYIVNTIGKDFKAYQTLGKNFYEIIDLVRDSKKDVIVFAHSDTKFNDMGDKVTSMQVLGGKMINDLVPPSYFSTVLMAESYMEDGKPKYRFRTQTNGTDPAKSPGYEDDAGVWKTALEYYEPNDIALILRKLKDFES